LEAQHLLLAVHFLAKVLALHVSQHLNAYSP
jgi:hypothetical protein